MEFQEEYEKVCSLLRLQGITEDIISIFRMNKIDQDVLFDLDIEDLKQLGVTALGDIKKVKKVKEALQNTSHLPPGQSSSHLTVRQGTSHLTPGQSASRVTPGQSASHLTPGQSGSHPSPGKSTSHLNLQYKSKRLRESSSSHSLSDCGDDLSDDFVSPTPAESSSHLTHSSLQSNSKRAKRQSSLRLFSDSESDDDSINIRIQSEKTPKAILSQCGPRQLLLSDPEGGATSQSVAVNQDKNSTKCKSKSPGVAQVQIMQSVPDHLPGWEDDFTVPKQYSEIVMAELTTGQVTDITRRAIVQDVAAKCLNYCKYPSGDQIQVVASKIVSTFPILKDTIGTGSDSWSKRLDTRLKNMRRKKRQGATGMEFVPSAKKNSKEPTTYHLWAKVDGTASMDDVTYDRHKQSLKKEMGKNDANMERVRILMKECALNRRVWIKTDVPKVKDVQEEFPPLCDPDMLIEEFEGVTGKTGLNDMFGVKWENWVPKIVSYAQLCRKSGTEEYLKLLHESNVSKGQTDAIVSLLLTKLLIVKPKTASDFFFVYMEPSRSLTSVLYQFNNPRPYIIGTGEDIFHLKQFYIICENQVQKKTLTDFRSAVVVLMAYYYVFNISYPPQAKMLYGFMEKFCFDLPNLQKLSATAIGTISSIQKQQV